MATKKTTALVNYDADFASAALAAQARAQKAAGSAKTIKTRSGILTIDGAAVPGNQLYCIVMEDLPANAYYEGSFNASDLQSPCCFAFQDEDLDVPMAPHPDSLKPQHELCATCPKNQFGSAIRDGKPAAGKACKNNRRLIVLGAGVVSKTGLQMFDADTLTKQPLYQLTVPPTSGRTWDGYITQIGTAYNRPPYGVVTRISARPHPTNTFELVFEYIDNIPNELVKAMLSRRDEAIALSRQPYSPPVEKPAAAAVARKPAKAGARY